ncbi:immunoglobulin-like domain-containing protein [Stigmatella hybrida]|uniref:immunoglobulin-like domain-containing protein n=1 Tax=Stigmatella hybrida TaxID=394097 RepID=UPI001CDA64E8|nr:DUF5011 domain-containing protein [Stigmatella hybrida]
MDVNYGVAGTFWGTPAVWNPPSTIDPRQYAETSGSLTMALPQGAYTISPQATMVSDSGESNTARFAPLSVNLGCGQRVKLVPPLSVIVNPLPGCATGAQVPVTGVVKSRPAAVDRIWYQLNGGPEVTLCTNCGLDPAFSFQADLQSCGNNLQVFAHSAGLKEPAFGSLQIVWDDPADGPSCPDTYCVNHQPNARCRSVTVPLDAACSQGTGAIDDGSFDPDGWDTVSCQQMPEGPFPAGTHRVRLTCTDTLGLSDTCEADITVRDMTPPQISCPAAQEYQCTDRGAVASSTASAVDNCGAPPSVTCAPAAGQPLPLGTTHVTCTASDAAGNRASCAFPANVADTQAPVLAWAGADPLVMGCGDSPTTGVTATDACEGDLSHAVKVLGLNLNQPGTYSVHYEVSDSAGHTAQAGPRTVTVLDSSQLVLSLHGNPEPVLECGVDTWMDPGASATEGCLPLDVHTYNSGDDDGDGVPGSQDPDDHGPGPNVGAEGLYPVQYIAWNAQGHTVSALRSVHVEDRTAPVLTLRGALHLTHPCGSPWIDPGVVATDACYGDLSASVTHTGYVNGWAEGLYKVRYEARDSGGNAAPVLERTVEVTGCPW